MRNKVSFGCPGANAGLDSRLARTRALVLGLLLAVAAALPSPVGAEVEINALGETVIMEGGERVGGGGELEASMHSSLLQDFQEVTAGIRAMEAVAIETSETVATAPRQNAAAAAAPTAFTDSSAVVGRIFEMKVPNKMEDVYLGDIVKVSPSMCTSSSFSHILLPLFIYCSFNRLSTFSTTNGYTLAASHQVINMYVQSKA